MRGPDAGGGGKAQGAELPHDPLELLVDVLWRVCAGVGVGWLVGRGLGWLTFGALLFGRWRYGWRGRVALRWIIAGTVFVFLAYLGYKFVLEVILGR